MMKCKGCGVVLQNTDPTMEGYVKEQGEFCERCFRIKHYNEYQKVRKQNTDFLPILKNIDQTNDLVVLVLDLLNLPENLDMIKENIHNPILLVLTKRDLLPRSIQDKYLLEYIDKYNVKFVDKVLISSTKNINLDELMFSIEKHQVSKNVYVVGFTNAGKSTMINTILKHYSDSSLELTTSMLTSTTLDILEVPCTENLTLLDTPGLLEEGNIVDYLETKELKKIISKKEIKAMTYQIKVPQTMIVDSIFNLYIKDQTNLTFYMSNQLKIDRVFKTVETKHEIKTFYIEKPNTDLVIVGLGFIRVMKPCHINIDINPKVHIYTRDSLIGK